ncbi:DUF1738 domain-containing protein [Bradyrhizobium jicamae]|uniref:DUF1738 domain-containing protein n=1 Tax=Bradyrhizobium jicamae TaxID=280332 RepID=A0ABS5FWR5_9BRAD|nr:DUF1738 domain-containing protein [Bradyrhizobium jicamae]
MPRFLTFKQALDLGGHVRKGEHGTRVYFVKQLQIRDDGEEDTSARLVPMMREYIVFNVDQCENLPDSVTIEKLARVCDANEATCLPAGCARVVPSSWTPQRVQRSPNRLDYVVDRKIDARV